MCIIYRFIFQSQIYVVFLGEVEFICLVRDVFKDIHYIEMQPSLEEIVISRW
jgi:hypothetical protein